MKLLVTGGAGFIGSNFIRHMLRASRDRIVNLDLLTYAGNIKNLSDVSKDPRYRFVRGDIADPRLADRLFKSEKFDAVVNFAAESHVDRSIADPMPFLTTNVTGVGIMLMAARKYGVGRFLQISTDEVYGSMGARERAGESDNLVPSSPYSASKAAADLLVMSYFTTHGMPVMITRSANNYGPYQFPEKLIPLMITNAREGKPLPVYGDGKNMRDWIWVLDNCEAIRRVLQKGRPGEIYNIGTGRELRNIELVKMLIKAMGRSESLIKYVADRPGHDRRYAMKIEKVRRDTGWRPATMFKEGLPLTVKWYLQNEKWWKDIVERDFRKLSASRKS